MRAALDIALKDLRQKVRDRSAILLSVVAPFGLAALFGFILGGLEEDFHARWALVDLDGGTVAAALDEGPIRAMEEAGFLSVERLPTAEAARGAVEEGRVETAIIVPAGFSAATVSGSGSEVELIVDPDAVISGQVARSVMAGCAHEVEAVRLSVAAALGPVTESGSATGLPDPVEIAGLAEKARQMAAPIALVDASAADRQASNATYYAAAMAILFVFLSAQFGLVSIHAEKRDRTLARMLAAPLHWWSILAGKIIVSLVLALVSMSVIVVGTALLLGASWGDPLAVAALVIGAAVAASGVSLLVVAFTGSESQAAAGVAVVAILLAVLGGSFVRANQGPDVMAQLSLLTPHAWFLRGVNDAASGGDIGSVAGPAGILLAIGLVTGGLGLLRSRRMVLS